MTKLTDKQQAFVAEYLIDLNATQAAVRAGYSAATAYSVGHENLRKPEIAQAIARAQAERAEKCDIKALWVLHEAKAVYEQARASGKLCEALSALKLIGTHIDVQAFRERVAVESIDRAAEIERFFNRKCG